MTTHQDFKALPKLTIKHLFFLCAICYCANNGSILQSTNGKQTFIFFSVNSYNILKIGNKQQLILFLDAHHFSYVCNCNEGLHSNFSDSLDSSFVELWSKCALALKVFHCRLAPAGVTQEYLLRYSTITPTYTIHPIIHPIEV